MVEEVKKEIIKEDKQEEHLNEQDGLNNKNNKKVKKILIVIGVILLLILLLSSIFAIININNQKIISGIKIDGIDVSGLSKEEAKKNLQLLYDEKIKNEIQLQYEEYESVINPTLIETSYNIDEAIDKAYNIGKTSNIFVNNYQIIWALIGKIDINVDMTINEDVAINLIQDIETNIPGVVHEPEHYIEGENLIITKGKKGVKIDTEKLLEKIKNYLTDNTNMQICIDIPVTEKIPNEIDIDKIHEEVYKEVQDAYYTKNPFTIHAEVEGIDFNVEEAKALLEAEEKEEYVVKLEITKPKVTINDIGTEAFPDLLATFTTIYDASDKDRTTNLRIACQKLNDKVILPDEIFSYNQTLGERTISAGYKNAKVYENGQVVDGIGGGICQISSTLYNSVLLSNLQIIERRNHQFVTSYVKAGRDATVVYGQTDFKFKNTRNYAVKIKANISNGIATVSIYGIKEEKEYSISFETKTISSIPYTVKYQDDATLNIGTEKVKQKGANGIITETYIIKSLNGVVVSKELLSKDTYNAMQRIILKGTKGATTNTNNNNTNNTTSVTNTQKTNTTTNITTNPNNSSDKENQSITNQINDLPQNTNTAITNNAN